MQCRVNCRSHFLAQKRYAVRVRLVGRGFTSIHCLTSVGIIYNNNSTKHSNFWFWLQMNSLHYNSLELFSTRPWSCFLSYFCPFARPHSSFFSLRWRGDDSKQWLHFLARCSNLFCAKGESVLDTFSVSCVKGSAWSRVTSLKRLQFEIQPERFGNVISSGE